MAALTLLLVLMAATIVLAPLAERIAVPYPVLLLMFGLVLALVPGLPMLEINPELLLPLVLPPLLFAAARRTSWREFLDNRRPILLLAVALVAVTAFAVGLTLQALVPGLPLVAAVALGAAVAPPDPVAATAVARKLGLPHRLRTILEGEGLSNDATALVLYDVAVAATLTGAFSPWHGGKTLALAVAVGIAVGIGTAALARLLMKKLPAHPAGSALILLVPFGAYAAADAAHGSGVLAVVTVALALDRYGDAESSQTRLVAGTTWEIMELLVTGAAFAFVGLELRAVASQVDGRLEMLLAQAAVVTAVVIVVRFAWIFPVAFIDEKVRRRHHNDLAEPVGWREMTVASWAGMRGVVTLVAALALPPNFPERDRLIFIAFVVISVTLLLQGLTLPWLVRRLRVSACDDERHESEQEMLRRAREAGFRRLDELRQADDVDGDVVEQASENAHRMWHSLGYAPNGRQGDAAQDAPDRAGDAVTVNAVKDEMLAAARDAVVEGRRQSGTDPTIADLVLRRLDSRGTQPE